jgi:hypothetical protein
MLSVIYAKSFVMQSDIAMIALMLSVIFPIVILLSAEARRIRLDTVHFAFEVSDEVEHE